LFTFNMMHASPFSMFGGCILCCELSAFSNKQCLSPDKHLCSDIPVGLTNCQAAWTYAYGMA